MYFAVLICVFMTYNKVFFTPVTKKIGHLLRQNLLGNKVQPWEFEMKSTFQYEAKL